MLSRKRLAGIVAFLVAVSLLAFPPFCLGQENNRGLFVTVLQEPQALSSSIEIDKLVAFCHEYRIKNLFVQIYRANQAWFASEIADPTPYQTCLKKVGRDPVQALIERAHHRGIRVFAWLNMLSLGQNKDSFLLKKYGSAILTTNRSPKSHLEDFQIDHQYFLEPSDPQVHRALTGIVKEIVRAYPELDGILFDYIRYPDVRPDYGYASQNLDRFTRETGIKNPNRNTPQWQDWKRRQVTELLQELADRARALRPGIRVAATGCAPYSRAYLEAFQDWPRWLKGKIVDFVAFMSYEADPLEYRRSIQSAQKEIPGLQNVMVTVGAYKQLKTPERFARLMDICEKTSGDGCIIFHYGSMIESPQLKRMIPPSSPPLVKPK